MSAILHYLLRVNFIDPYLKRALDNFVQNYQSRMPPLGAIQSFEDYDTWSSVYWENLELIWG